MTNDEAKAEKQATLHRRAYEKAVRKLLVPYHDASIDDSWRLTRQERNQTAYLGFGGKLTTRFELALKFRTWDGAEAYAKACGFLVPD